jgi:23S rRNA (guanosine2251-2'-O)-methyltransferase
VGGEVVYGPRVVAALLETKPLEVKELWVLRARSREIGGLVDRAEVNGIRVHRVERATLDRLCQGAVHQGVAARCRSPRPGGQSLESLAEGLREAALLVVLDGVQDPHNLGAVLRSADAAGAHGVVVPRSRAAGLGPAARKVACGAAERVPLFVVPNLVRALEGLKHLGLFVLGCAAEAGTSIFEVDLTRPIALVLGSEHEGLRRLTREHCDLLARIPMRGTVPSLNVSVAAGVCLFEAVRQREAGWSRRADAADGGASASNVAR